jgi:hypothetical protein
MHTLHTFVRVGWSVVLLCHTLESFRGQEEEVKDESPSEYKSMDLEMLREVVPMLRQQTEKSMLDRNYVQLERVSRVCV